MSIPFFSNSCLVQVNLFFKEVHRILNPEGHFLFADMIEKEEVADIRKRLQSSGFTIVSEKEITKNVAKGLALDSKRRELLIDEKIPGILKKSFERFAGTEGTDRFNSFQNGKFEYWSFILTKN